MSGDRLDLLTRIQELQEENKKLDYLYHRSLSDYVRQFDELQKYKKALDKACKKLSTVIDIEGCNQFCEDSLDCDCCNEYNCSMSKWWKEWCMENE